jgi:D-serine dehydratase
MSDKGNVYYTGLGLAYKPIAFPKQLQDIKDTFATLNSVGVISNNNEVFYINDKLIEDSDQDPHNKVYVSEDSNLKGDIKAIGGKYEVNYAIVA